MVRADDSRARAHRRLGDGALPDGGLRNREKHLRTLSVCLAGRR
jgi:hypothetical protein